MEFSAFFVMTDPPNISLPPFLSSLALNRPDASDEEIQKICDSIVECLFSVFVTSGKPTPSLTPSSFFSHLRISLYRNCANHTLSARERG